MPFQKDKVIVFGGSSFIGGNLIKFLKNIKLLMYLKQQISKEYKILILIFQKFQIQKIK